MLRVRAPRSHVGERAPNGLRQRRTQMPHGLCSYVGIDGVGVRLWSLVEAPANARLGYRRVRRRRGPLGAGRALLKITFIDLAAPVSNNSVAKLPRLPHETRRLSCGHIEGVEAVRHRDDGVTTPSTRLSSEVLQTPSRHW